MKIKPLLFIAALFANATILFSQDLIQKVPSDASVVITFNNKAFFEKIGINSLNTTLTKFGFFEEILDDDGTGKISKIEDFGIDLHSKAYTYVSLKDSVNYVAALIPLANKALFESIIPSDEVIEQVNNLPTIYSKDRTVRMSWDNNTLYVLSAIESYSFFSKPEVMGRYGLLSRYDDYDYYDEDQIIAVDSAATFVEGEDWGEEELATIDTTTVVTEEYIPYDDEYDMVDSILGQEEYSDDYYTRYDSIYKHNDSIKNSLLSNWLNIEFEKLLTNDNSKYYSKRLKSLSNNTLVHVYSDSINSFTNALYGMNSGLGVYNAYSPYNLFAAKTGMVNFGIESFDGQIDVVANKIKLIGGMAMQKDVIAKYKEIYKKGVNPKFYRFLDKDLLGFMTVNVNTEAYLKNLPSLINKYYGPLFPQYDDFVSLGANIFETLLDEKAIGKVFKGDNLFLLNGVTKSEISYTDYEYDDDYNYIEVERTKMETIPQFLWMFSSEDTRIFQQLLQIGVKQNELTNNDGIFSVNEKNRSGIQIYIQIKDGIVFIGNDLEKMNAIKGNSSALKGHSVYIAIAKKNTASFVFNTKRIPVLLEELEIPVGRDFENLVSELNKYGDFTITVPGIIGNSFKAEATIELPNSKENALQYLLELVNNNTTKN